MPFYWYQIFAIDSAVVEVQEMFSPHGSLLTMAMYHQNGHSDIDKTKFLTTNGSLMKVDSIAECSVGVFCNALLEHSAKLLTCIKR